MNAVRIALAQINTIVGDLVWNSEKILLCIDKAIQKKTDLIVFPELSITGYPPEDLLLKPHFIKQNLKCIKHITMATRDIMAIVGFVDLDKTSIYNSAAILVNKKLKHVYHKTQLPNYGVFDEKRYFKSGDKNVIIKTKDFSFTINICEDIWADETSVMTKAVSQAHFMINISASPFYTGKARERLGILLKKNKKFKIPILYCNLIGGQDELVFDGRSLVLSKEGKIIARANAFEEDLLILDLPIGPKRNIKRASEIKVVNVDYKSRDKKKALSKRSFASDLKSIEEIFLALVLGVRDYVKKNGFRKVAFGLSGGIDSAVVACIAEKALGKANCLALSMPSRYSSKATQDDAEKICKNLGMRLANVPIDDIFDAYNNTLSNHFVGMKSDITEENVQARIRGNILMAFSNKLGYLVLNTGNKSETSVGYCTLYGDMTGGFSVIKDVPKKLVYELAKFINTRAKKEIIPKGILERPPSAELRPDQKDQDTLPPYELVDKIIDLYIEKNMSLDDILKKVKDKGIAKDVLRMIDMNEHKRRQSPPGIKITPKAFGRDRRMPITNKFKEGQI